MRYRLISAVTGFLCLLVLGFGGTVQAQQTPDYEAWDVLANRAENLIEAGQASDETLETLRSQLAEWREQFLEAEGINSSRISTLQGQINALGPPPDIEAGDAPEPGEVATRREQLNDQMVQLRAPAVNAEEAYSLADGLIREIDNIIRERRADQLLQLGPSPLIPARWAVVAGAFGTNVQSLAEDSVDNWRSEEFRRKFWGDLPVSLLVLVLGLVLTARGRSWATRLSNHLRLESRRGAGVFSFLTSLGQIILPMLGVAMVTTAINNMGLLAPNTEPVVQQIPAWITLILLMWWMAEQVFSRSDATATVKLEPSDRKQARFLSVVLGVMLAAHDFISTISDVGEYTDNTRYLLDFPILVLTSIAIFRLGQVLAHILPGGGTEEGEEIGFLDRVIWALGRMAMAVGVVGPIMAAIGYGAAADALVYPAVGTLFLAGVVTIIQRLIYDLYYLATGASESEQAGLVPVLAGFLVAVLALPLLALIWGARLADLTEVWAKFQEGFAIGDSRISPTDFLTFAVVFTIGYMLTRMLQGALRSSILPKTKMDAGGQTAVLSGIGYVGIAIAALVAITTAGIDLTALGYVAGALSVGIGFGLQNIVSNFVSGIILLIERPIGKGDWIEVNGQMGYVRDISVRSTRIETFDRTDVIVPNSDFISGTVTNFTRGNTIGRVIVPVGVAYGTDTRRVEEILREIANDHPMVLANPAPNILFKGFGADSLDFEIRAILRDVNWVMNVHSEMNHQIAARFVEEGIEIPFAQRDVWLRNPEALNQRPEPQKSAPGAATDANQTPEGPEEPDAAAQSS